VVDILCVHTNPCIYLGNGRWRKLLLYVITCVGTINAYVKQMELMICVTIIIILGRHLYTLWIPHDC